jgi:hypothetical protein
LPGEETLREAFVYPSAWADEGVDRGPGGRPTSANIRLSIDS